MEVKVTLTDQEIDDLILSILCDGLYYMGSYGFSLDYSKGEYKLSAGKLTNPCIEDVQLQMLKDGYGLTFIDEEDGGEFTRTLTYELVKQNLPKVPSDLLMEMVNKDYDAGTADSVLQYLLFDEIVFG